MTCAYCAQPITNRLLTRLRRFCSASCRYKYHALGRVR